MVTVNRGDMTQNFFYPVGASGGITTYADCWFETSPTTITSNVTTLSYDGANFKEYFNDGMQIEYTNQGIANKYSISKVSDSSGVAHTYTYHTSCVMAGLLQSIQVPGGNLVTWNYIAGSSTSLVSSITDWGQRITTFQYASGNLTTITSPLGCQTGYTYSGSQIQSITDNQGYTTSYGYDSSGRVTTLSAGSANWNYSYQMGRVVMTAPNGVPTTYNIDGNRNLSSVNWPAGYTTTYTFNSNRMKIQEQTPAGNLCSGPNIAILSNFPLAVKCGAQLLCCAVIHGTKTSQTFTKTDTGSGSGDAGIDLGCCWAFNNGWLTTGNQRVPVICEIIKATGTLNTNKACVNGATCCSTACASCGGYCCPKKCRNSQCIHGSCVNSTTSN